MCERSEEAGRGGDALRVQGWRWSEPGREVVGDDNFGAAEWWLDPKTCQPALRGDSRGNSPVVER